MKGDGETVGLEFVRIAYLYSTFLRRNCHRKGSPCGESVREISGLTLQMRKDIRAARVGNSADRRPIAKGVIDPVVLVFVRLDFSVCRFAGRLGRSWDFALPNRPLPFGDIRSTVFPNVGLALVQPLPSLAARPGLLPNRTGTVCPFRRSE